MVNSHQINDFSSRAERFAAMQVLRTKSGLGMSRARYYWRQADICMRLSLLSNDSDIAELLINKAIELMSQAETAAAEEDIGEDADGSAGDGGGRH
jgi:hypothetical protein